MKLRAAKSYGRQKIDLIYLYSYTAPIIRENPYKILTRASKIDDGQGLLLGIWANPERKRLNLN